MHHPPRRWSRAASCHRRLPRGLRDFLSVPRAFCACFIRHRGSRRRPFGGSTQTSWRPAFSSRTRPANVILLAITGLPLAFFATSTGQVSRISSTLSAVLRDARCSGPRLAADPLYKMGDTKCLRPSTCSIGRARLRLSDEVQSLPNSGALLYYSVPAARSLPVFQSSTLQHTTHSSLAQSRSCFELTAC